MITASVSTMLKGMVVKLLPQIRICNPDRVGSRPFGYAALPILKKPTVVNGVLGKPWMRRTTNWMVQFGVIASSCIEHGEHLLESGEQVLPIARQLFVWLCLIQR